jgi:hypothetical protein
MRCAVCRCFRGEYWSICRVSSMNSITGTSLAFARNGTLCSGGTALTSACRTIRRRTAICLPHPEPSLLQSDTPAGSVQIVPPSVSCPSPSRPGWQGQGRPIYRSRWGQIRRPDCGQMRAIYAARVVNSMAVRSVRIPPCLAAFG